MGAGAEDGRGRGARVRHVRLTCAVLLAAVVTMLSGSSASLAAGPVLRVDALSDTSVAPGGSLTYLVQVTNTGSVPTSGPYTVTINLSAHASGVDAGNLDTTPFASPTDWLCTAGDGVSPVAGASTILCVRSTDLPHAGPLVPFVVDVAVDGGASGVLTSTFDVAGGGAPSASTSDSTRVSASSPGFGVAAFDAQVAGDASGAAFSQAGGHPFSASTSLDFNTLTNPNPFIGPLWPVEASKDVLVDVPPGLAGYPPAAAKCSAADLRGLFGGTTPEPLCPPSSQVGTTLVRINGLSGADVVGPIPVYNMVTPSDVPARFGFNVQGSVVTLDARVRNEGGVYGLTIAAANLPEALPIASTSVTLWGVPADPSHDSERACAGVHQPFDTSIPGGGPTCTSGAPLVAFLRNPTACDPPAPGADGLTTSVHVDSWAHPGPVTADGSPVLGDARWQSASVVTHLPPAYPAPPSQWGAHQLPTGCEKVPFDPKLSAVPQAPARVGAPSGFVVDLDVPQSSDPAAVGEADLRKAVVTLPAGVRVSPSSAAGLGACSPDQIALDTNAEPSCPDSAKVGSLTITTPLLEGPLSGSVYLATPHQNPFNSLIAIYFVVRGPGVVIKLPGKVETDLNTGQLKATFDNQPQLPFSNLHVEFFGGSRSPLVMPNVCGTYTTHTVMTSWSGKTVSSDSSFDLSADGNGAPCPPAGFSPALSAWAENPIAGKDSSFVLWLTRTDQDHNLSSLSVDMPSGLLGRIANTTLCPDGAAGAGACQDVSKIGDVTVGAGAGSNPFFITNGRAYITGPYKGAPYGLSIVVPAVAGPFDLGNVVVRAAIFVDKSSAALHIVSDPLPTILEGIPLDVRDVRVFVNKPHFIVNPTSCAEKRIVATVGSTEGAVAHPSVRFQVGECANLGLAPKLSLTVGAKGHTKAGVSTPLTATVTMPRGDANLRSTSVTLPGVLNALLPVVNRACKLTEFQAGKCGSKAQIGTAVAVSPLLRDPLRGSVYFVKNPARAIPDLMVALRGPVSLDVTAKVAIPGGKRLATRFDTIPDAPLTKFTLRIVSGKNGPVGIATNLCSAKGRAATAAVGFRGQNGALLQINQRITIHGCPNAAKAKKTRKTKH